MKNLISICSVTLCLMLQAAVDALKGVDVSTSVSQGTWSCIKNNGFGDFAVVRVFQQLNKVDPNAATTIRKARAAGITNVEGYFFPDPYGDPAAEVQKFVNAGFSGSSAVDMVWLDIEGQSTWPSDVQRNRQFITNLINAFAKTKFKIGIYTSKSQWDPIVGNDFKVASHLPLWYAHYDGVANVNDFGSSSAIGGYGGWSAPSRKQYNGDKTLCGAGVDFNFANSQVTGGRGGCSGDNCYVGDSCQANGHSGTCQRVNGGKCSAGSFVSGACPGSSNVKCCICSGDNCFVEQSCNANGKSGICQLKNGNKCSGSFVAGFCPGSSNVECCVASKAAVAVPPAACSGDSCYVGHSCSASGLSGSCQLVNGGKCGGSFLIGACPGSSNVKCCVEGDAQYVGHFCSANRSSGTCQLVNGGKCGGTFIAGACPGSSDVKCCVAKATSPPSPPPPSNTGRQTVKSRAGQWVDAKLLYCQAPNGGSNWPNDPACPQYCHRTSNALWDPYRSDCSGFISWAWNLPAPGRTTRNFAPFQTDISSAISASNLQLGDAVNNDHHVMLFIQWDNGQKTHATFWEEPGCSSNPNHARPWSGAVSLSGTTISISGRGDFMAIRYAHVDSVTNGSPDDGFVGTHCSGNGKSGTCQLVNGGKCHGTFVSGACPGSSNVKCCV